MGNGGKNVTKITLCTLNPKEPQCTLKDSLSEGISTKARRKIPRTPPVINKKGEV
jgi:hypothetical protein